MDVAPRPLGDLAPAAGVEAVERLRVAAAPLAGLRVLHITLAGSGGGAPDLLGSLLPLAADAGLDVEWRVLFGGPELQEVAGQLRDGLQGAETAISDAGWRAYEDACATAAAALDGRWDAIVLHDPGTLGLVPALTEGTLVWRCHVDAGRPDGPAWERLSRLANECGGRVFGDLGFAPASALDPIAIAPGIDPVAARNLDLAPLLAGRVLRGLGLDLDRPFVTQLMRLDRWEDPHTSLDAFARIRAELPTLQLVLGCEVEGADAARWPALKEISDYAAGQDDVHLLTSYAGLGNVEVGALNQISRAAVRSSLREGFGLAASEALWRGTPVVGGTGGGTALQVRDGVDGYLADDADAIAARVGELVDDPGLAIEMGRAGRERVRERFLVSRVLEDELGLLARAG
jgi:trehalose synthase